jgi:serine phosphatase RsbU (regulator of sigma subunit)
MTTNPVIHVCLIDDDEDYFVITRDLLSESECIRFDITWISSYKDAQEKLAALQTDVILLDYQIGPESGLDLLSEMQNLGIRTPVIMLTGQGDKDIDLAAMKSGVADYLVKGKIDTEVLQRAIRYAIEHAKTLEQLRTSRDSLFMTTQKLEKTLAEIHEEMETAQLVQKSLLPQNLAAIAGIDCAATYMPSGMVGGDLYDIVQIDNDSIGILILDVCGHGVPAALIATMAKISFTRNIYKYQSPRVIFTQVNGELSDFMPDCRYVTAFLAIVDLTAHTISFSRAGHPPALLYDSALGTIRYLSTPAPLIGCFYDSKFEEAKSQITKGDVLVFYTDGLAECENAAGVRFNMLDLENVVSSRHQETASQILRAIELMLSGFREGAGQADDITIVVAKIK